MGVDERVAMVNKQNQSMLCMSIKLSKKWSKVLLKTKQLTNRNMNIIIFLSHINNDEKINVHSYFLNLFTYNKQRMHLYLKFNIIGKKIADGQIIYIEIYKILVRGFSKGLSK